MRRFPVTVVERAIDVGELAPVGWELAERVGRRVAAAERKE
jgi:hypothetical protein